MATLKGNVGLHAQGYPNVARRDASSKRLIGGAPADGIEKKIGPQRDSARTELIIDGTKKFASSHT